MPNMNIVLNILGPGIWINNFLNSGYISVSAIDLLGPGQLFMNFYDTRIFVALRSTQP